MKLINIKLMAGQAALEPCIGKLKPAVLIYQGDGCIILTCTSSHPGINHELYRLMFIEYGHGPGATQSPVSLLIALFFSVDGCFATG